MLRAIAYDEGARLREFLLAEGYTEASLAGRGISELPSAKVRNVPRLRDLTHEACRLNVLLRWFWLGESQSRAIAEQMIPQWFTDLALGCGLLQLEGESLIPQYLLVHVEGLFIASDHPSKIDQRDAGLVLWPNPTSKLLARFTIRRRSKATLDLGAGTGILALGAASFSEIVVATDLNDRATECAIFNARLNGVRNVECLTGDAFAPVEGRKFDLILSNPPFFITPSNGYMFCDNPLELDSLCRSLAKEAPSYLNEGGYFQMLCEWAQVGDQTWQERVSEWVEGTGCDGWILKGQTHELSDYTQMRIAESTATAERDGELYDQHMAYYRQRNVKAIHGGLIALRRRDGQTRLVIEEWPETPSTPFGDTVLDTFARQDFLQSHSSDEAMGGARPRISPDVRLESFHHAVDGKWQPAGLTLRLTTGFPFFVELQPLLADFLGRCDGKRTVNELCSDLAARLKRPVDAVAPECLKIVRTMIERGLLLPGDD
jgi:SAM-dependent methyltransferase